MTQTFVKQVFPDVEALRETWKLPVATPAHVIVALNGRVGVTLSGTPGQTTGFTLPGIATVTGLPQPDNGQSALKSSIHTTGTFEGAVVGASSTTVQNTPVYLLADGTLSLTTGTDAVKAGVVNLQDGYVFNGTVITFKIGV